MEAALLGLTAASIAPTVALPVPEAALDGMTAALDGRTVALDGRTVALGGRNRAKYIPKSYLNGLKCFLLRYNAQKNSHIKKHEAPTLLHIFNILFSITSKTC